MSLLSLLAAVAVTNLPPPYYSVEAAALGASVERQVEILARPLREKIADAVLPLVK